MKIKLTILTIILIVGINNIYSQSCLGFEKKCINQTEKFQKKSLSKSFSIKKGEIIVINHTFYEDNEYYISILGSDELGDLRLKLLNEKDIVLFDNSLLNFKTTQDFIIKNTTPIRIELSAPNYSDLHYECLGIQIFFEKI